MTNKLITPMLVAFVLALAIWYPTRVYSQVPSKVPNVVHKIPVEEIGKTVVLIGRLGVPLGEKMEVSGYWQVPKYEGKAESTRFVVSTVNGTQLPKPLPFDYYQLDLSDTERRKIVVDRKAQRALDGQRWTLTAYETGRIHITPNEQGSKSPVFLSVQMPQYTRPFTSELVGVLLRKEVPK